MLVFQRGVDDGLQQSEACPIMGKNLRRMKSDKTKYR